jgi:hypothetical protein
MADPDPPVRLPLPSEDSGDLVDEPREGQTDDYLVAREEGVPYVPPTDRVISEARDDQSGPDFAGAPPDDEGTLERDDTIQARGGSAVPRDEALLADCLAALRDSDITAGERLRVAVQDATVILRGEVESVTILDEIVALLGDVPGVEDVRDEVTIPGV